MTDDTSETKRGAKVFEIEWDMFKPYVQQLIDQGMDLKQWVDAETWPFDELNTRDQRVQQAIAACLTEQKQKPERGDMVIASGPMLFYDGSRLITTEIEGRIPAVFKVPTEFPPGHWTREESDVRGDRVVYDVKGVLGDTKLNWTPLMSVGGGGDATIGIFVAAHGRTGVPLCDPAEDEFDDEIEYPTNIHNDSQHWFFLVLQLDNNDNFPALSPTEQKRFDDKVEAFYGHGVVETIHGLEDVESYDLINGCLRALNLPSIQQIDEAGERAVLLPWDEAI
ncbi:Hypothetical protein POVN_LOCUS517 [uncultured virus]|nr:Hypothetical protein POVN_LOCUS517 [uncultured virus]